MALTRMAQAVKAFGGRLKVPFSRHLRLVHCIEIDALAEPLSSHLTDQGQLRLQEAHIGLVEFPQEGWVPVLGVSRIAGGVDGHKRCLDVPTAGDLWMGVSGDFVGL